MAFISLGELTNTLPPRRPAVIAAIRRLSSSERIVAQPPITRPKILTLGPCTRLAAEQSQRAELGCRTGTASFSPKHLV